MNNKIIDIKRKKLVKKLPFIFLSSENNKLKLIIIANSINILNELYIIFFIEEVSNVIFPLILVKFNISFIYFSLFLYIIDELVIFKHF